MQVANAVFMMPRAEGDCHAVIQAMLQGMSWSEKHRQADLASRNAYIASQGRVHCAFPALNVLFHPATVQYLDTACAGKVERQCMWSGNGVLLFSVSITLANECCWP